PAVRLGRLGGLAERGGDGEVEPGEQVRAADGDLAAPDGAADPGAGRSCSPPLTRPSWSPNPPARVSACTGSSEYAAGYDVAVALAGNKVQNGEDVAFHGEQNNLSGERRTS
ncbi:MAG: hypothetical protein ACRDND_27645, partial [Streptosporangiaceae bacterium]